MNISRVLACLVDDLDKEAFAVQRVAVLTARR
jgi:hypothetical protein